MSNNARCEIADHGVFVAQKQGDCLRISVPAKTSHDWERKTEFIDLPFMDKETFDTFVLTIQKFRDMYDNQ